MKFLNKNEVDEPCFKDIMTSEIVFYENKTLEDAIRFCKDRHITYLPSRKDDNLLYQFCENSFKEIKINDFQKVEKNKNVFDNNCLELFKQSEVLFVFNKDKLIGIVHFCDYNKEPILLWGYSKILKFEKGLRKFFINNNLKNEDMINFIKEHPRYKANFEEKLLQSLEPFQCFNLSDLVSLLNHSKILNITPKIISFRNFVMHNRNLIENINYEEANLSYDFDSFKKIFDLVKLFNAEILKIK